MKRALQAILAISVAGGLCSGTLLYRETCRQLIEACTLGGTTGEGQLILGYPPSLYALVVFLLLAGLAALGLRSARQ